MVAVLLAASLHRVDGRRAVVAAVALVVTAGPAVLQALPLLVRTQEVEELRPVLAELAERRAPGDLVLVDIAAKGAFDFYAPRLGVPRDGVVLFRRPRPGRTAPTTSSPCAPAASATAGCGWCSATSSSRATSWAAGPTCSAGSAGSPGWPTGSPRRAPRRCC